MASVSLTRTNILDFQFSEEEKQNETDKLIFLGTRPLEESAGIFNHWAVKIGKYWFEVGGESKKGAQEQQQIYVHQNDSEYDKIYSTYTCTNVSYKCVQNYCKEWLKVHPNYEINGNNCQMFVQDISKEFGKISIETENKSVGNGLMASGIVLAIGGLAMAMLGALVKGSH